MVLTLAALGAARAGPEGSREALDRLEELLELRVDGGELPASDVVPAVVVSLTPRYEETTAWFPTRGLEVLAGAFGASGLRLCEACMEPRAYAADGSLVYQAGPIGLDEVVRLDDLTRGDAEPARAAIWLDEQPGGVSIRIVDLRTGRLLYARNVDPMLVENANTERMYTLSEELERRARGESITQAFVDLALYPRQHVSLDWTDQWGATNANLSGVTISMVDPIVGIGAVHARRIEVLDTLIGAKLIVSVPTALVRIVDDTDVIDPLLTGVAFVRVPFGRSNYGAFASGSTNGAFGVGISLMNIRLLPVVP